ncbi:sodium:proton antiporter [Synechococcus sp. BA-124 BA4]|uniref:cation:proton antiporter n=1 Tax=unclassified Synechococcus TaxID=2626047 RepID=UPI002AD3D7F7|nr:MULTISPECIES: sodium:proton antiporter [unclassified Synechococcus]MEA5399230.1 sodium:proton antiporter [Synechococcus sp. BA-124 BA4]CAK6686420.1 K(+)/H(+) antiporter NhaP [Synechococcus sp. CBW1107]
MSTPSIDLAQHILLQFGIILAVGSASAVFAQKLRVPDVVVFLFIGTLLGPEMLGLLDIKVDSTLNQVLLIFGSCYILFDGGASLRLPVLKEVWITILSLATFGVLITAAVTAVAAFYFLGIPWIQALLLATAIASTDPATLVPVFRQVRIRDRVAQTVISESALNDATGAILTFAVLGVAMGQGQFSLSESLLGLLHQSFFGLVAGLLLGYLASTLIAHETFGFLKDYSPVVSLMAVIGAYLSASGLHASGFMAVFVFGFMVGNKDAFGFAMKEGEQQKLDDFVTTTALIMRMFIFFLLGSQVDFGLIIQYLIGGVGVVVVFMLVARPLTVFLCALPDRRARWSLKELLFMCWTRETGVIPGALAGLLLGIGAPGAKLIASVTFIAILMTILIQATTTRWLASRLGLLEDSLPLPLPQG